MLTEFYRTEELKSTLDLLSHTLGNGPNNETNLCLWFHSFIPLPTIRRCASRFPTRAKETLILRNKTLPYGTLKDKKRQMTIYVKMPLIVSI